MYDSPPMLIVADRDDRVCTELVGQLLADGFAAEPARSAQELRCRAARGPDLLVLGELAGETGALTLLRELRSGDTLAATADPWLPVVFVSAAPGEWVPLRAFEAGCDDFVRKPIPYLELRARIRAILRRTMRTLTKSPRRVGALAIDPDQLEARFAGVPLELSRLEFALLARLAREPLRVFTKAELLRDVWGYPAGARTRTLDAHACRLRRKLGQAGARGHVVNMRGIGYRLVERTPTSIGADHANGEARGAAAATAASRRVAAAA